MAYDIFDTVSIYYCLLLLLFFFFALIFMIAVESAHIGPPNSGQVCHYCGRIDGEKDFIHVYKEI
jgi:hypothetical protein